MNPKTYLTLVSLLSFITSYSQIQRNTGQFSGGLYSGATIETFSPTEKVNPDDNYLYSDWILGSIDLDHTEWVDVKQILLRYNVVLNELEIKVEDKVRVIGIGRVKEFRLLLPGNVTEKKFIKGPAGVLQVIHEGQDYSAYLRYDYNILAPDYNAQFDTGSKVPKTIIKESYVIKDENSGSYYDFKLRSRSFIKTFEEINNNIYTNLKKEKVKVGDIPTLREAMMKVNSNASN